MELNELTEILEKEGSVFETHVIGAYKEAQNTWAKTSDFPFLHIASYDYYIQKFLEPRFEEYVRSFLFNGVLAELFRNCGYEASICELPEDKRNSFLCNKEIEDLIDFQIIFSKDGKVTGLRYSDFLDYSTLDIKTKVDEIIILSLQEPFSVEGYEPSTDESDDGIKISWTCIKDLFFRFFGLEYCYYTDFLQKELNKAQEYIGIKTISKLSPNYLFSFRQKVNSTVRNDVHQLQGYQPISAYNISNHSTLQSKSKEMVFAKGIKERYFDNEYYNLLFGKNECCKSLVSSEFLREQFPCDERFDFTSIVSGYLKSVEQLMYRIARLSMNKGYLIQRVNSRDRIPFTSSNEGKIDKTMGALRYFFKENKDNLVLVSGDDFETFDKCILLYSNECRNYSFHKNIIDDWHEVETIRKNTFFMYVLLLGSCKLEGTRADIDNAFGVIDDRLEQMSLYLDDWEIDDFFYQYGKDKQVHAFAIQDTGFPEYDDYGFLKSNKLQFRSVDEPVVLTIQRDCFPDSIWHLDRNNQKHEISFLRASE